MKAGRELDALIAEKVMGWHLHTDDHNHTYWANERNHFMCGISPYEDEFDYSNLGDGEDFHILHWHPSESILWAWEVVEKLRDNGDHLRMEMHGGGYRLEYNLGYDGFAVTADTAPLAICLVALKAVGYEA